MGFGAGAIEGGIHFDISEFAHGMLEAEAISSVFPPMVVEFLEHPLLAFTELAKESFEKVGELIEGVAGHFHQMGLEAMKAGVEPQTFSTLAAAAKASGVSVEGLGNAFKFLEDRASTALRGDQEGLKAFADIGIKTRELKELLKDPEELFYRVSDALHAMDDQGLRVRSSMELMSRAGVDMLPFLQQGRAGVQDLAAQMGRLGGGVSEAEAAMGEHFGRMEAEVSAAWDGLKKSIAEPVLEVISGHLTQMEPVLENVSGMIRSGLTAAVDQMMGVFREAESQVSGVGGSIGDKLNASIQESLPLLNDLLVNVAHFAIDVLPLIPPALDAIAVTARGALAIIKPLVEGWKYLYEQNSPLHTAFEDLGPGTRFNAGVLGPGTRSHLRDGSVGQPQVNVNANIHLDANAATSQIAQKLKPHVQKGMSSLQSRLEAQSRHALASRRNGGRG